MWYKYLISMVLGQAYYASLVTPKWILIFGIKYITQTHTYTYTTLQSCNLYSCSHVQAWRTDIPGTFDTGM